MVTDGWIVLSWDAVPSLPVPRMAASRTSPGGDWPSLDALSAEWGCFATSLPHSGKVTWALIGAGWRDHPPV